MRLIMLFILFVSSVVPFGACAQSLPSLPSFAQNSIAIRPQSPEPGQEVTATLNAYAENTTGATIEWFLDQVELTEFKNTREITFTTGALGVTQQISARVTPVAGVPFTLTHSITPARVDLIVESNSLVPVHYKGRALPSIGSQVRAVAIIDTGGQIDPESLSYSWKLNNKQQNRGSLIGANVAEFEVPLGHQFSVSVSVADTKGKTIAQQTTIVFPAEPEVLFYENNPLRGLSKNAIASAYQLLADEVTVRAEPYYMDRDIFNQKHLAEWSINGSGIDNPSDDPQNVTLRKSGGSGNFTVSFSIRNLQELLQGAEDEFTVSF